jgi:hypothetical protein
MENTNAKTSWLGTVANVARCRTIVFSVSVALDVRRELFCDLKNLVFNENEVPSSGSSLLTVLFEKRRGREVKGMALGLTRQGVNYGKNR